MVSSSNPGSLNLKSSSWTVRNKNILFTKNTKKMLFFSETFEKPTISAGHGEEAMAPSCHPLATPIAQTMFFKLRIFQLKKNKTNYYYFTVL